MTLCILIPFCLTAILAPRFSPDSWAYYELGQTVFGDFYRFSHFRSFSDPSPYSSAFPPLFPVLIALGDALFGSGARTGIYMAFLAFLAFALVSEKIGRQALGTRWIGLSVALVLLLGPGMVLGEMTAGRTIPLQLLLFALILLVLLRQKTPTLTDAVALGALAGLAVLNRFDAILLPVLLAAAIWWLTRRPALALTTLGTALVVMSPWMLYSIRTFGTLFATDNSGIATSLDPQAFVTDWWPDAQPTLADDPMAWVARVLGNILGLAEALGHVLTNRMSIACGIALGVVAVLQRRARQAQGNTTARASHRLKILATTAAISLLLLAPQALTGYSDVRYFSILIWAFLLVLTVWLISKGGTPEQRASLSRTFSMILIGATALHSVVHVAKSGLQGRLNAGNWDAFETAQEVQALKSCLGPDQDARVLVLGSNTFAARAGAQGRLHTMMEPRNMFDGRMDANDQQSFIAFWEVSHVLGMTPRDASRASQTFDLRPVPDCTLNLFEVGG